MAHAYTTKRGKNKKAKLNKRMDHAQNQEKSLKQDPLANLLYDGPKESVFQIGRIGTSSRIENVVSRLQKSLLDRCSNTGCKNTSAEGTLSECASCHQSRYCGRECQLAHWGEHKTKCKEIRNELRAREKEKQDIITAALQDMNLLAKPASSTSDMSTANSENVAGSVENTTVEESESESEDEHEEDTEDVDID